MKPSELLDFIVDCINDGQALYMSDLHLLGAGKPAQQLARTGYIINGDEIALAGITRKMYRPVPRLRLERGLPRVDDSEAKHVFMQSVRMEGEA